MLSIFLIYMYLVISGGIILQDWLTLDYMEYLEIFNGNFYTPVYDFHWWSYLLSCIALYGFFFAIYMLVKEYHTKSEVD